MGLFGAIGSAIGGSKGKGSLSDFMKQFTSQNNSSGNKPVDDSHTHSNSSQRRDDAMQKRSGGRPEMQQPVPIVQPNNMANNNYTNPNTQRVGADLFKGEALASQTAQRRMTGSNPTPLPGEESGGMGDNQLEAPLMQTDFPHAKPGTKYNHVGVQNLQEKGFIFDDKKGPYVVNEELTGTSRDTLRLPKNVWRSPKNKPYNSGNLIDDGEYMELANKVNKK